MSNQKELMLLLAAILENNDLVRENNSLLTKLLNEKATIQPEKAEVVDFLASKKERKRRPGAIAAEALTRDRLCMLIANGSSKPSDVQVKAICTEVLSLTDDFALSSKVQYIGDIVWAFTTPGCEYAKAAMKLFLEGGTFSQVEKLHNDARKNAKLLKQG